MKRRTLLLCSSFSSTIPAVAHAWETRSSTRADCNAVMGSPGSAITSREVPDPVRRCDRIPQTAEERAIVTREREEARKRYEADKSRLPPASNNAR